MAKPSEVPGLGPDTPLQAAGRALVAARLADVRRYEGSVDGRLDADAIHDMRVASRRLRAAVALFGGRKLRAVEREVKRLQDALGDVRDVQVQLEWLGSVDEQLRARERPAMRAWVAAPLDRHAAALRSALRRWRRRGVAAVEEGAAAIVRKKPLGGKRMERRLGKRTRRVAKLAREVRRDPEPAIAHELRIAAKKLRYTAELLEPAFTGRVKLILAALVPLQETLGSLHDADVHIERLGELAGSGEDLERSAARRLLERLRPERDRLAGELGAELDALSGW